MARPPCPSRGFASSVGVTPVCSDLQFAAGGTLSTPLLRLSASLPARLSGKGRRVTRAAFSGRRPLWQLPTELRSRAWKPLSMNERAWLCSNKTVFTWTGSRLDLAPAPSLAGHCLDLLAFLCSSNMPSLPISGSHTVPRSSVAISPHCERETFTWLPYLSSSLYPICAPSHLFYHLHSS